MLPTKEELEEIKDTRIEAEKDFKNRALMVIETLCGDDLVITDIEKFKSTIYRVAHSAREPKVCKHEDWVNETEEMFRQFNEAGI